MTLPETSPQEFLGLAADYWQAISTFVAPVLAGLVVLFLGVWIGGQRLRQELQGKDARHYFLDEGLDKLSSAYEQMLGATRMNYAVCCHLLRLLRNYDQNDLTAPRPDDLPPLMPTITDTAAFAAIGPSAQVSSFLELGTPATKALAGMIAINLSFLTEIWLPIRSYYSRPSSEQFLQREEAFKQLSELAEKLYREAEEYRKLPQLLGYLALRAKEVGLNSFDDLSRLQRDQTFVELCDELKALSSQIMRSDAAPS